jgi:uncharacterized protein YhbP (UPF0306 family)
MALRLPLPAKVAAYVAAHHVMTLATSGPDGPWAAAVFYVADGGDLLFMSSPTSRHATDLASDARCAAAIHAEVDDWRAIKGIQLEGVVTELPAKDRERAQALYDGRFPFARPAIAPPAIVRALARVRWYRLRVGRLCWIDNEGGFGERREFDPGTSRAPGAIRDT